MSVPEAARRLGVSNSTLWRWLKEGKIRGLKVGSLRKIRVEDLSQVVREDPIPYAVPTSTRDRLLEEMDTHVDRIRQRLGGNLASDSAEVIREMREERR
ncbi:MAG: helix-turn-helix domain-containing protein [Firmicutes bacterium]|nr:helix-turn-helix domain-containing protein [Bacillota bacterium]